MTIRTDADSRSLIDALKESFQATLRSPEGVADPVVLLWTDADGQWRSLIPALKAAIPELFTYGPYDPTGRSGPVIWLKCVVERTLPNISPAPGQIPILYLPLVSRQELRAGGDCPPSLQPLIELQYRGAVWHQRNAKDWTVEAFLTSEYGVGLDIAQDNRTREAMLRSLPLLATQPLDSLKGRRLEADDFDRLSIGDPIRDILSWMSNPEVFQKSCDTARWDAFRNVCSRQFGFDPENQGPSAIGDGLLYENGKLNKIWERFREAPHLYSGMANLLREVTPPDLLYSHSRRPTINQESEIELRHQLETIPSLTHEEACNRILALEKEHQKRRQWVWKELGESPLVIALEPLAHLAQLARSPIGGTSLQSAADHYAKDGWRCDRAAIDALNSAKAPADVTLISNVVRVLYVPWLEQSARHFQQLAKAAGTSLRDFTKGVTAQSDTCILFVDGLRFDLAGVLQEKLEARNFHVRLDYRLSPLPTVTATAKPLASPAFDRCEGGGDASDFTPVLKAGKQPFTAQRLRNELTQQGMEVLDQGGMLLATSTEKGGWAEIGQLDKFGHSLGARLVGQIYNELETITEYVVGLINAGWSHVRIVTDHGWLLVPGGMKKIDLPPSVVATKWARCAAVQGESTTEMPTFPWYWNADKRIASPPGIGAFIAGTEYAHGGVSFQECVTPDIFVERGVEAVRGHIKGIEWRRMRCRVMVDANTKGLQIDLRLNWKQPATSIAASVKEVDTNGEASLAVADDSHEGAAATIVLMDKTGQILDYKPTTIGEDL